MTWGAIGGGGTSSATYTVTTALIVGAATTSGIRLDLGASNELEVREGDDSAYAPLNAGTILTDTALIVGAATTSGVRLDLESGTLAVREGDDSGYAAMRVANGSASAPGLSGGAANTGLYFDATSVYVSAGGAVVAAFTSTGHGFAGYGLGNYSNGVNAFTTDQNLSGRSSNVITNEGAAGAVNHSLPSAAAGLWNRGVVHTNQYIRFTAAAGDTIRDGATVSAAAGYIRSTTVGSTICLQAINATEWVVMYKTGTWTIDS